MLDITIRK